MLDIPGWQRVCWTSSLLSEQSLGGTHSGQTANQLKQTDLEKNHNCCVIYAFMHLNLLEIKSCLPDILLNGNGMHESKTTWLLGWVTSSPQQIRSQGVNPS